MYRGWKQPPYPTHNMTKTVSNTIELPDFPEKFLDDADLISLCELMESPIFASWVLSALSNGMRFARRFEAADHKAQEKLEYKVFKLLNQLDRAFKFKHFVATSNLIREAREAREAQEANA